MEQTVRNRKNNKGKQKKVGIVDEKGKCENGESLYEKHEMQERQLGDGESSPDVCIEKKKAMNNEEVESTNVKLFRLKFEVDLVSVSLFFLGLITRMYRLEEPRNIV